MIIIPFCLKCEHCRESMVCEAYPDGIPKEILLGQEKPDHVCNNSKIGFKEVEPVSES